MNAISTIKTPKACLIALALGLVFVSARTLKAEIHSDFDPGGTYFGGTEGWFNYGALPGFTTATPAGGSSLWLQVKPQQYYGKITSQNWAVPDITVADWNSNTYLKFDVIVDNLWFPNNPVQPLSVEFQVGGGVDPENTQPVNTTIDASLKNTIQQVSIPLAALQPFDPTATYWNLSIDMFPAYAWEWDPGNSSVQPYDPHYSIDNVRWVPEPGSLLLAALGAALGLASIRRRPAA